MARAVVQHNEWLSLILTLVLINRSLSWRRAESVEQYLAKHGAARQSDSRGRARRDRRIRHLRKLRGIRNGDAIACVQPDRRVEVTSTAKR